jgi:hypothetical protein
MKAIENGLAGLFWLGACGKGRDDVCAVLDFTKESADDLWMR